MKKAIVHAGMAGALWGGVIVLPSLFRDVHPVVISCARFALYGAFAALVALPHLGKMRRRLSRREGRLLLELALTGNVAYFMLLTAAVQLAGVSIAALINGMVPLAVMLIGRRHVQATRGSIVVSLAVIGTGIVCMNLPVLQRLVNDEGDLTEFAGIACAGAGVLSWAWFSLRNAQQLKTERFTPQEWSTLQGVATGIVALLVILPVAAWLPQWLPTELASERLWALLAAALFMSIGGSWVANALWNSAAKRLPVSVGGQMIVFETCCALLYGYLLVWQLPAMHEVVGMTLMLGGVIWTLRAEERPSRGGWQPGSA